MGKLTVKGIMEDVIRIGINAVHTRDANSGINDQEAEIQERILQVLDTLITKWGDENHEQYCNIACATMAKIEKEKKQARKEVQDESI